MRFTNVIIQTATKVILFIILIFSLYLFFAGHHQPGGGFVGGLVSAAAIVLLAMAFGLGILRQGLPLDFKLLGATGGFIVVASGLGSLLADVPFLSQTYGVMRLPLFGEVEWSTAVLFDLGVFLAVIGVTLTIILSISEDG